MRKEWLLCVRVNTELKQTVLNSWYVKTIGICPSLEIATKNQSFLENPDRELLNLLVQSWIYE